MSTERDEGPPSRGTVFNVQHYSLHDGPGTRTTVFLKGCPLHCRWCSNPEGLAHKPQLSYRPAKCIGAQGCDRCRTRCAEGAIGPGEDGRVAIDFARCTHCGDCVPACPARALEMAGHSMSVDEVMQVVERDGAFYRRSGGGLTLSGGECAMQPEFAEALLRRARASGLNTAIETSGFGSWARVSRLAALADVVHYDIKHLDPVRHAEFTGVRNDSILENFRRLCALEPRPRIIVRTPVIPGFNDTVAEIDAIAAFVAAAGEDIEYELLPYHRFGENKYRNLGMDYPAVEIDARVARGESELYRRLVALAGEGKIVVPWRAGERAAFLQSLLVGAAQSGAPVPRRRDSIEEFRSCD